MRNKLGYNGGVMAIKKLKKKSIRTLKRTADKVFSKWIRHRDRFKGCITCGKKAKVMHAGHWMGRGAGAVRYNEKNVHSQCSFCNVWGGGEVTETYRRQLNRLYGKAEVEKLYIASKQTHRFTKEELEGIIEKYRDLPSALPVNGEEA